MIPILEPYKVTSPFGAKRNIPPWGEHTHDGIDLVSSVNKNVYAALAGTVLSDKDDYDHAKRWISGGGNTVGNRVVMKHKINGETYYSAYYHLINNYVSDGQEIEAGKIIGQYDDVGMSYGAHLHFMMWDANWKVVDPKIGLEAK